jgi:threonine dehydrogenase-like Zn-dependent dehydrogenase
VADHRALVITEPSVIGLQDVAPLVPGPGEVVARPAYVGVCGTDLELLDGVVDPAYVNYPLVPGHEWSGLIEAVGPGVTGLTPGQPVIAEGIIPDRTCAQCVRGNTNLCLTYDEIGFTRAGAAADQLLLPAQVVHPLAAQPGRPNVRLEEAALAEPAAVAWRGITRGQPRPGERIAVVGDGTVGLITTHLLRLYSPAELVVFGQREEQAGLAAELGATAFELAGPAETPAEFDLVIEAARRGRASPRSRSPAAAAGWSSSAWPAPASPPPSRSTTSSTTTSRSPPASAIPPPPGPKSRACSARASSTSPR